MATYPEQYPGDLQALANQLTALRADVDRLRARSFRIPILSADPPATDPTNMWAFPDGRIRVRMPDGSVANFIEDAAGSSTSGTAAPTTTTQQSYVTTWGVTWTGTYKGNGSKRNASSLFYGNNSDGLGRQKCMWGFNASAIQSALAGASIQRVELYFEQMDCYSGAGCDLHFGGHNNGAAPGVWGGIYRGDVTTRHFGGSNGREVSTWDAKWVDLSLSFGTWFQQGLIQGISINQGSDSRSLYGYGNGGAPQLRISYVK